MTQVYEVMTGSGLQGSTSGPNGVTWGALRVQCGSGIAGHGDEWWVTFPGKPDLSSIGPVKTPRQLQRALRTGLGVLASVGGA